MPTAGLTGGYLRTNYRRVHSGLIIQPGQGSLGFQGSAYALTGAVFISGANLFIWATEATAVYFTFTASQSAAIF